MIQEAIRIVTERQHLSRAQARDVMDLIMSGGATPAQIAAFAIAQKLKGETYHEVAGFAEAMRAKAARVETRRPNAIDMCGTGGDGKSTFNISTVASFVVAAGGIPVAKHGNRSVSSKCGSADLLEALGVTIDLDARQAGLCLDELGIAFLFAPALHPAMKHAIGPRREMGVRTVFNILGPLTNPAHVKRQVLGVYSAELAELMALVLRELTTEHVLVIHSEDGLDEVSIQAPTSILEVKGEEIRKIKVTPESFGLEASSGDDILGGEPEVNARIALEVLKGVPGTPRDVVIANAACGLLVGGAVTGFREGADLARTLLDSGKALEKLESLKVVARDVKQ